MYIDVGKMMMIEWMLYVVGNKYCVGMVDKGMMIMDDDFEE